MFFNSLTILMQITANFDRFLQNEVKLQNFSQNYLVM